MVFCLAPRDKTGYFCPVITLLEILLLKNILNKHPLLGYACRLKTDCLGFFVKKYLLLRIFISTNISSIVDAIQ